MSSLTRPPHDSLLKDVVNKEQWSALRIAAEHEVEELLQDPKEYFQKPNEAPALDDRKLTASELLGVRNRRKLIIDVKESIQKVTHDEDCELTISGKYSNHLTITTMIGFDPKSTKLWQKQGLFTPFWFAGFTQINIVTIGYREQLTPPQALRETLHELDPEYRK